MQNTSAGDFSERLSSDSGKVMNQNSGKYFVRCIYKIMYIFPQQFWNIQLD